MNQYLLIPIVVGVFVTGIGVSYAIFSSDYDPTTMKFRNQQSFDHMMAQNPKMSAHWMETMPHQPQMGQNMMGQGMMGSMNGTMMWQEGMNQHMFMHDMMMSGISDPIKRQQVMDEMNRHHQAMLDMLEHAIDDPQLREQLRHKIEGHMMNQMVSP